MATVPSAPYAVATFDDETAFLSQVSNATTYDFEVSSGFPTSGSVIGAFGGHNFDALALASKAISGTQVMTGNPSTFSSANIAFGRSKPSAVGFFALDLTLGEVIRVSVDFTNGPDQVLDISLAPGDPALTPKYFGLIADDTIERLTFVGTDDQSRDRAWKIDDLTIAFETSCEPRFDQANDRIVSGGFTIPGASPVGQEFVPATSSLDVVELQMNVQSLDVPSAGSAVVRIRSGDIAGPVLGESDPVMITGVATPITLARFHFSASVPLLAGATHVLEVVHTGGFTLGVFLTGFGANSYSAGTALFRGAPRSVDDLWFRTGSCGAGLAMIFGTGCAGSSGTPTLTPMPGELPVIGEFFTQELTSIPPGQPVVALLGLSSTVWGGVSLPEDIGMFTGVGATGCQLYTSIDAAGNLGNAGGTSLWDFPIPNNPSLHGVTFYTQCIVLDPGANAANAIMSNAVKATIVDPSGGP